MWTLTIPAIAPITSSTLAMLHTLPISPMDPRQTPNITEARRIMTPRLRIFHTPASSAPSSIPAAIAETIMPYTAGEPNLVLLKYARPSTTGPAMQKFMIVISSINERSEYLTASTPAIGARAAVARFTTGTASVLSSRPTPSRASTAPSSTLKEPQIQPTVIF